MSVIGSVQPQSNVKLIRYESIKQNFDKNFDLDSVSAIKNVMQELNETFPGDKAPLNLIRLNFKGRLMLKFESMLKSDPGKAVVFLVNSLVKSKGCGLIKSKIEFRLLFSLIEEKNKGKFYDKSVVTALKNHCLS
jgi:hypothetical protein